MIRIGFIGAGLIGKERVRAAKMLMQAGYPLQPVGVLDSFAPDTTEVAGSIGTTRCFDFDGLLEAKPDWVVVATPHDVSAALCIQLLRAGVRVLVEKPMGRDLREAEEIAREAPPAALWVGQNFRFFEGIAALLVDLKAGVFGPITSISMQLAHGGGPKDKGTWKLDPVRAGGGVLIDPGIHLLDLINCIEERPPQVIGGAKWSGFWNTGIEEDLQVLLKGEKVPVYDVKVSLVHWRSTFRFEVHGLEGYGVAEGRGRSYGPQRYWRGPRWGWQTHKTQADSEQVVLETDGVDVFVEEMRALLFNESEVPGAEACSSVQALANMRLIEDIRERLQLPSFRSVHG
jgi:predicted dehydrogenase